LPRFALLNPTISVLFIIFLSPTPKGIFCESYLGIKKVCV